MNAARSSGGVRTAVSGHDDGWHISGRIQTLEDDKERYLHDDDNKDPLKWRDEEIREILSV